MEFKRNTYQSPTARTVHLQGEQAVLFPQSTGEAFFSPQDYSGFILKEAPDALDAFEYKTW